MKRKYQRRWLETLQREDGIGDRHSQNERSLASHSEGIELAAMLNNDDYSYEDESSGRIVVC